MLSLAKVSTELVRQACVDVDSEIRNLTSLIDVSMAKHMPVADNSLPQSTSDRQCNTITSTPESKQQHVGDDVQQATTSNGPHILQPATSTKIAIGEVSKMDLGVDGRIWRDLPCITSDGDGSKICSSPVRGICDLFLGGCGHHHLRFKPSARKQASMLGYQVQSVYARQLCMSRVSPQPSISNPEPIEQVTGDASRGSDEPTHTPPVRFKTYYVNWHASEAQVMTPLEASYLCRQIEPSNSTTDIVLGRKVTEPLDSASWQTLVKKLFQTYIYVPRAPKAIVDPYSRRLGIPDTGIHMGTTVEGGKKRKRFNEGRLLTQEEGEEEEEVVEEYTWDDFDTLDHAEPRKDLVGEHSPRGLEQLHRGRETSEDGHGCTRVHTRKQMYAGQTENLVQRIHETYLKNLKSMFVLLTWVQRWRQTTALREDVVDLPSVLPFRAYGGVAVKTHNSTMVDGKVVQALQLLLGFIQQQVDGTRSNALLSTLKKINHHVFSGPTLTNYFKCNDRKEKRTTFRGTLTGSNVRNVVRTVATSSELRSTWISTSRFTNYRLMVDTLVERSNLEQCRIRIRRWMSFVEMRCKATDHLSHKFVCSYPDRVNGVYLMRTGQYVPMPTVQDVAKNFRGGMGRMQRLHDRLQEGDILSAAPQTGNVASFVRPPILRANSISTMITHVQPEYNFYEEHLRTTERSGSEVCSAVDKTHSILRYDSLDPTFVRKYTTQTPLPFCSSNNLDFDGDCVQLTYPVRVQDQIAAYITASGSSSVYSNQRASSLAGEVACTMVAAFRLWYTYTIPPELYMDLLAGMHVAAALSLGQVRDLFSRQDPLHAGTTLHDMFRWTLPLGFTSSARSNIVDPDGKVTRPIRAKDVKGGSTSSIVNDLLQAYPGDVLTVVDDLHQALSQCVQHEPLTFGLLDHVLLSAVDEPESEPEPKPDKVTFGAKLKCSHREKVGGSSNGSCMSMLPSNASPFSLSVRGGNHNCVAAPVWAAEIGFVRAGARATRLTLPSFRLRNAYNEICDLEVEERRSFELRCLDRLEEFWKPLQDNVYDLPTLHHHQHSPSVRSGASVASSVRKMYIIPKIFHVKYRRLLRDCLVQKRSLLLEQLHRRATMNDGLLNGILDAFDESLRNCGGTTPYARDQHFNGLDAYDARLRTVSKRALLLVVQSGAQGSIGRLRELTLHLMDTVSVDKFLPTLVDGDLVEGALQTDAWATGGLGLNRALPTTAIFQAETSTYTCSLPAMLRLPSWDSVGYLTQNYSAGLSCGGLYLDMMRSVIDTIASSTKVYLTGAMNEQLIVACTSDVLRTAGVVSDSCGKLLTINHPGDVGHSVVHLFMPPLDFTMDNGLVRVIPSVETLPLPKDGSNKLPAWDSPFPDIAGSPTGSVGFGVSAWDVMCDPVRLEYISRSLRTYACTPAEDDILGRLPAMLRGLLLEVVRRRDVYACHQWRCVARIPTITADSGFELPFDPAYVGKLASTGVQTAAALDDVVNFFRHPNVTEHPHVHAPDGGGDVAPQGSALYTCDGHRPGPSGFDQCVYRNIGVDPATATVDEVSLALTESLSQRLWLLQMLFWKMETFDLANLRQRAALLPPAPPQRCLTSSTTTHARIEKRLHAPSENPPPSAGNGAPHLSKGHDLRDINKYLYAVTADPETALLRHNYLSRHWALLATITAAFEPVKSLFTSTLTDRAYEDALEAVYRKFRATRGGDGMPVGYDAATATQEAGTQAQLNTRHSDKLNCVDGMIAMLSGASKIHNMVRVTLETGVRPGALQSAFIPEEVDIVLEAHFGILSYNKHAPVKGARARAGNMGTDGGMQWEYQWTDVGGMLADISGEIDDTHIVSKSTIDAAVLPPDVVVSVGASVFVIPDKTASVVHDKGGVSTEELVSRIRSLLGAGWLLTAVWQFITDRSGRNDNMSTPVNRRLFLYARRLSKYYPTRTFPANYMLLPKYQREYDQHGGDNLIRWMHRRIRGCHLEGTSTFLPTTAWTKMATHTEHPVRLTRDRDISRSEQDALVLACDSYLTKKRKSTPHAVSMSAPPAAAAAAGAVRTVFKTLAQLITKAGRDNRLENNLFQTARGKFNTDRNGGSQYLDRLRDSEETIDIQYLDTLLEKWGSAASDFDISPGYTEFLHRADEQLTTLLNRVAAADIGAITHLLAYTGQLLDLDVPDELGLRSLPGLSTDKTILGQLLTGVLDPALTAGSACIDDDPHASTLSIAVKNGVEEAITFLSTNLPSVVSKSFSSLSDVCGGGHNGDPCTRVHVMWTQVALYKHVLDHVSSVAYGLPNTVAQRVWKRQKCDPRIVPGGGTEYTTCSTSPFSSAAAKKCLKATTDQRLSFLCPFRHQEFFEQRVVQVKNDPGNNWRLGRGKPKDDARVPALSVVSIRQEATTGSGGETGDLKVDGAEPDVHRMAGFEDVDEGERRRTEMQHIIREVDGYHVRRDGQITGLMYAGITRAYGASRTRTKRQRSYRRRRTEEMRNVNLRHLSAEKLVDHFDHAAQWVSHRLMPVGSVRRVRTRSSNAYQDVQHCSGVGENIDVHGFPGHAPDRHAHYVHDVAEIWMKESASVADVRSILTHPQLETTCNIEVDNLQLAEWIGGVDFAREQYLRYTLDISRQMSGVLRRHFKHFVDHFWFHDPRDTNLTSVTKSTSMLSSAYYRSMDHIQENIKCERSTDMSDQIEQLMFGL